MTHKVTQSHLKVGTGFEILKGKQKQLQKKDIWLRGINRS